MLREGFLMSTCYSCIHLMPEEKTADGVRCCRVDGLPISPALEEDCKNSYVREVGSDDAMPEWYRDAWHVGGEGRGD